ncbi:porin [Candidatus Anaplasma sp. TIGMIC]|uniref:porin n=1 Tax=Candidatus Anaplasma sp. TIGMIC TaxID=3020713 RepID=UPI002330E629|nr:porin [Candidatus Anaplasma sp. TIGMIC]MDB1134974.1 porin [Candidatus Anaplasma sp. TIGMIC]
MRTRLALCAISCFVSLGIGLGADATVNMPDEVDVFRTGEDVAAIDEGANFSFDGRVTFYNWGGVGKVPDIRMPDHVPSRPSIKHPLLGNMRDAVNVVGEPERRNLGWSGDCDFSGEMSFEYLGNSGVSYGADFQVLVPAVSSAIEVGKALVNRGSRIYLLSRIGKFSVGYQQGAESVKRSNFDDFIRGLDSTLLKYQLPLLKGDFFSHGGGQWWLSNTAILYPGLYSESISRSNNYLDYYGIDGQDRYYSKYFVNNLPLRIAYQSPSFFGMQVGLSYSPTGYAPDLFTAWLPEDARIMTLHDKRMSHPNLDVEVSFHKNISKLQERMWLISKYLGKYRRVYNRFAGRQYAYAPSYKSILGAAWSVKRVFRVGSHDVNVDLSLSSEYAPAGPKLHTEDVIVPEGWFRSLAAAEVSASVKVRGFSVGGSYGYLGKSGYPEGPWAGTEVFWDEVESDDTLKPSSYVAVGAGYAIGPFRVDGAYFRSRKGGYLTLVNLSDLGMRMSYELYKGDGMRCVLFTQLHKVRADYRFSQGFTDRWDYTPLIVSMGGGKSKGDRGIEPLRYDFGVLVFGVKLAF